MTHRIKTTGLVTLIMTVAIFLGLTSKAMSKELIEPGVSMGDIHIGQRENTVASLTKMKKYLSSGEIVVRYSDDGEVIEIMTQSQDFKTKQGLDIHSSSKKFRRFFSGIQLTCTISYGGIGFTTSEIFDDLNAGIALAIDTLHGTETESIKNITVHRKGVPVSIFGEIVDCTKAM